MSRFQIAYAVTIDRPVDEVFRILALPEDLERVLRLSPMVVSFGLLGVKPGSTKDEQVITFEFGERVYSNEITMRVEQTVDSESRRVDYWSQTKSGVPITVHKVRTFEDVGGATKVSELIDGEAPFGVHLLARRTARSAHVEHMESYHRLFED